MAKTVTLETLYEKYGHHVYRRCLYLLADESAAWDATQDVFLKADKGLHKFEGRASHLTWLSRIATHHCLNVIRFLRVRRGQGTVDASTLESHVAAHDCERAVLVRKLLSRFDVKTQACAIHYYVDEMSQEEVAAAVGLSVPTVRKRLRQFVEKARRELSRGAITVGRAA